MFGINFVVSNKLKKVGNVRRCYAWLMAAQRGEQTTLAEAEWMWLEPHELPEGCGKLVQALLDDERVTVTDVWHRVRVLFPTDLKGDTYLSDSAFDVVERPVALAADNAIRKELDVETRPQISWTAFADGVKPVHSIVLGGDKFTVYTGLLALALNVVVAIVVQALLRSPAPAAAVNKA